MVELNNYNIEDFMERLKTFTVSVLTFTVACLLVLSLVYGIVYVHYNTKYHITHTSNGRVIGEEYSCIQGKLNIKDSGVVADLKGDPIKCTQSEWLSKNETIKRGY
jgi:hypothetical protein